MQNCFVIVGLVMNLVGAILVAWADARFINSVEVSLLAIELNFAKLLRVLRRGGVQEMVQDMDEYRDNVARKGVLWKRLGWIVMIVGYALQIVAIALAKSGASDAAKS